jgi:hypothetical protein
MKYSRLHSNLDETVIEEMAHYWQVELILRSRDPSEGQIFAVLDDGLKPGLERAKEAADRAIQQYHRCDFRCGPWKEHR